MEGVWNTLTPLARGAILSGMILSEVSLPAFLNMGLVEIHFYEGKLREREIH